jgi:hypothetical protein
MGRTEEARFLDLKRTFAQPDAVCIRVNSIPAKWQVNDERDGIRLVYEPREYVDGRALFLLGELHDVPCMTKDGSTTTEKWLVKYDGQMREDLMDWWVPHDETWIPLTLSDKEVAWLKLKEKREQELKKPEFRRMVTLVQRVRRGSKTAVMELAGVPVSDVEEFRSKVRELELSIDLLVYTTPRKIRRMMKEVKIMDKTEGIRRVMVAKVNSEVESDDEAAERKRLEAKYGQVWDSSELVRDFDVLGFMAPLVVVTSVATGKKGSLQFQDMPRFYFGFTEG